MFSSRSWNDGNIIDIVIKEFVFSNQCFSGCIFFWGKRCERGGELREEQLDVSLSQFLILDCDQKLDGE